LKELPSDLLVARAFTLESLFRAGAKEGSGRIGVVEPMTTRSRISVRRALAGMYKAAGRLFSVPDSRILWLPAAFLLGVSLVATRRIEALFASGPSFTNLVLGALIKAFTRVPLVVDFRDAWIADPMFAPSFRFAKAMHGVLERFVARTADRVISTNPFVTQDFAERYPHLPPTKWHTIYNGYDRRDSEMMQNYRPHRYDSKFVLVYTGRLYGERTPYHYLRAVSGALLARPAMREDTRVVFVGSCETFLDGRSVEDYCRDLGLSDIVELPGHLSRRESLEYQMEATILVLLIGIVDPGKCLTYGISGKVFDYVISDRPILAISEPGASSWFLKHHGIGTVYSHTEEAAIAEYLVRAYDDWRHGVPLQTASCILRDDFSFEKLTGRLAGLLAAVARRNGGL
jgi:glycosyltransferase involved in cell wall biosynthesis